MGMVYAVCNPEHTERVLPRHNTGESEGGRERKIMRDAPNLRVDGEHFGLAEVVRTVNEAVVVVHRHVAVVLGQRTRDVEPFVDDLRREKVWSSGGRARTGGGAAPSLGLTEIRKNTIQERENPLV